MYLNKIYYDYVKIIVLMRIIDNLQTFQNSYNTYNTYITTGEMGRGIELAVKL